MPFGSYFRTFCDRRLIMQLAQPDPMTYLTHPFKIKYFMADWMTLNI